MDKYLRAKSLRDLGVKRIYNIPSLDEASSIQQRAERLYNTRIDYFGLGDIRFMIGQEIGVEYLVDIALDSMKEDIFLDTEYYEGDLLSVVLKLSSDFWETHSSERYKLLELLKANHDIIFETDLSFDTNREIKKLAEAFMDKYKN